MNENQRFVSKSKFFKVIFEGRNRTQQVLQGDMGDIGSGNIHPYHCKLPDEIKINRIKSVKLDTFDVVLDPTEFF